MDQNEIIERLEYILSEPDDTMREYLESLVQDIQYPNQFDKEDV